MFVATLEISVRVSIREFNSHVSQFLRRAHAGETVVVTRREEPFVEIVAPGLANGGEKKTGNLRKRLGAIPGVCWSGKSHHDLVLSEPVPFKGEGPTASEMVLEGRR